MKNSNYFRILSGLIVLSLAFTGCSDDDEPPVENPEEVITTVTLTFTPSGGGTAITASATDPDGEGPDDLEVDGDITLDANTTYTMTIELTNDIENEDVTEEIVREDHEHMFFFAFTNDLFDSPTGNGNVDDRGDELNYNDQDENQLPVGLSTSWTTGDTKSGTFQVILKHQPNVKTATSDIDDGESEVDVTWDLSIQ
ncbi:hypothetical protein QQ020_22375 [Fulvivirgaceae bacterium BMA12]|uniref:Lipoprotein n=1 Tax=Agaribacillus aureus TaxID=3051825 RepID=A0ABT8LAQ3_9BACT|nr:hypothetical protein [Fulvivirgaceae bacterium BMA12]